MFSKGEYKPVTSGNEPSGPTLKFSGPGDLPPIDEVPERHEPPRRPKSFKKLEVVLLIGAGIYLAYQTMNFITASWADTDDTIEAMQMNNRAMPARYVEPLTTNRFGNLSPR